MKKLILILSILISGFTFVFADKSDLDFGLGLSYGPIYHLPTLDFEFKENSWDIQLGVTGVPYNMSYADDDTEKRYFHLALYSHIDFGYTWTPWENLGHTFGTGISPAVFHDGEFGLPSDLWRESLRLYFKYSYIFKSGWEIGAKTYLPIIGFYQQRNFEQPDTWDTGIYMFGSFYESWQTIINLFLPNVFFRYHF